MAVATLQVQAREIDELKKEIAELRAAIAGRPGSNGVKARGLTAKPGL